MHARRLPLLAALAATAWTTTGLSPAAHAAGQVEVTWQQPEQYADIGRNAVDRESNLRVLAEHLKQLAQRLPDGQKLALTVTDVNLAGELEPVRAQELRILRGRADWPTMTLRYTLSGPGGTLRSGEARLADMNYAFGSLPDRNENLGYEKRMLRTWFQSEFGAR